MDGQLELCAIPINPASSDVVSIRGLWSITRAWCHLFCLIMEVVSHPRAMSAPQGAKVMAPAM